MAQLTIRLPDELAAQVKVAAEAEGRSLNAWVMAILAAMVDPAFAPNTTQGIRERLERAGLLAGTGEPATAPDPQRVARARAAAGKGKRLSDLVSEGRR